MFGSEFLEVAIGIIFVYSLVSVVCTAIREGIESWLKTRAAYLGHGIHVLLQNGALARAFYEHPLIFGLYLGKYEPPVSTKRRIKLARDTSLPSYIPSKNFALALMDIAARGPKTDEVSSDASAPPISLDAIRANIGNLGSPAVQRAMLTAIDAAQGDIDKAQANIEAWYDSAMDRVSGWYRRTTQWFVFWIGLLVAVGLNINTITIADYLARSDEARAAIVKRVEAGTTGASESTGASDTAAAKAKYDEAVATLNSLSLPIGWSEGWGAPRRGSEPGSAGIWNMWFAPLLGWLLTAIAATMGAPFWFDMLNKVMVIRSTVKPHEKSPEEASEDRQLPGRRATDVAQPPAPPGPPPPAVAAPPQLSEGETSVRDDESDLDGCDVVVVDATSDEDLPAAEGGVA